MKKNEYNIFIYALDLVESWHVLEYLKYNTTSVWIFMTTGSGCWEFYKGGQKFELPPKTVDVILCCILVV